MPETIPVELPMVAMPVDPDVHVPPPELLSVVVAPAQTLPEPVIADGSGFTVTTVEVIQPVAKV